MDTEVLIVGAGPVGLTLSIDLGKRGVNCILIEKNDGPLGYPKMERCNPRTMEIFRRLGLADTVRAAGYPPDWPMDIYFVFDLMRPPLFKMAHPTVAQAKARRDATIDGSLPLEPYQIISQYTLEPLLKSVAERIPNVAVKFAHELKSRMVLWRKSSEKPTVRRLRSAPNTWSVAMADLAWFASSSASKWRVSRTSWRCAKHCSIARSFTTVCARRAPATIIASTIVGR
jgi:2-polyprenyl-6-methoxyphenol hydroxylase-like FAD-dependent oxidoreductase